MNNAQRPYVIRGMLPERNVLSFERRSGDRVWLRDRVCR